MKIGTVITCFSPSVAYGGPVNSTTYRVSELAQRGHDVTILTSNILNPHTAEKMRPGLVQHPGGFKVLRFPSIVLARHFSGILSFPMFNWLKVNAYQFDLFHISYSRELIPLISTQILLGISAKIFLQPHGMLNRRDGPRKWIDNLITKHQLNKSNRVVVLQKHENEIVQKIAPESKRVIIPNGIQITSAIPTWQGLDIHQPTILFLARLHPRKRVSDFIDAAKILIVKNPKMRFRIVGSDGGDELSAREKVHRYGLDANFTFVGAVPRKNALQELANASVYVLPSVDEPFATTITEALTIGVPTVVTKSTQNLDLLLKWDAVEPVESSAYALADGIEKLIHNEELCQVRSKNGKLLVSNELSINKTVSVLENLYKDFSKQ